MTNLILKFKKRYIGYMVLIIFMINISGLSCSQSDHEKVKDELIIFAASSLMDPYTQISNSFMKKFPHIEVKINYAGSQKLMTQISHGAKSDIFASADLSQIETLQELGLVHSDPVFFASNKLSMLVNNRRTGEIQQLNDLAKPNIKIVLAHSSVPIGAYSQKLIANIANTSDISINNFENLIYNNVVSYEDSVKSVVMKTVLGEADVGIVYASDAKLKHVVKDTYQIKIPETINVMAEYFAASIHPSSNLTDNFLSFLRTEPAREILHQHGFETE